MFEIFTTEIEALLGPVDTLKQNIREIVDFLTKGVGAAYDLFEILTLMKPLLESVGELNPRKAFGAIEKAFTFDSGDRFFQELDKRRTQFELTGVLAGEAAKGNRLTLADDTLKAEQEKLLQQQAIEADAEAKRHQERLSKFDNLQRSTDRLLDAVRKQETPTPVDL